MAETVWVNGVAGDGRLPVTDSSVLRGDGCFEVMRSYDGLPFALEDHLDRLEASAARLEIPLPQRADITSWVMHAAAERPWGAVRVVLTRGSALPEDDSGPTVIVFAHGWESPGPVARLAPVEAPWHGAGAAWDLAGAKVLSYAANLSATRSARREGFDDAVLVSSDGILLEGPTFSIAWVCGGVLETPSLRLGILDSITRRHVIGLAGSASIEVVEGEWPRDRLEAAQEVMALSTLREVQPVIAVGAQRYERGAITGMLARSFAQLVGASSSRQEV